MRGKGDKRFCRLKMIIKEQSEEEVFRKFYWIVIERFLENDEY